MLRNHKNALNILLLFINWISPIKAYTIAIKTGINPNQSVMWYQIIFTPVVSKINWFKVANPILELFTPICFTSTTLTNIVKVIAIKSKIPLIRKFLFLLFIINTPFWVSPFWVYYEILYLSRNFLSLHIYLFDTFSNTAYF